MPISIFGGDAMPRAAKCRRVCAEPGNRRFLPQQDSGREIRMTVEELEALRLCDLEDRDQEAAARQMDISRGTLQRILYAARKKTAQALVEGSGLLIEGGNYQVSPCCGVCGAACQCCPLEKKREHREGPPR